MLCELESCEFSCSLNVVLSLPLGSDGAEKGADCRAKPNWTRFSEQEETGIQMGDECPWWVDDRADISVFALCCLTVSS